MRSYRSCGRSPRSARLVVRLVPCANEDPLSRFFIVDGVLPRPYLAKFSYTCFRFVEGWQCLDEMQVSIVLYLVDAKGQTHPNLDSDGQLRGTVGRLSHRCNKLGT